MPRTAGAARPYDNRLRSEHARLTRERIVAALAAELVSRGADELSVGRLARRAHVSEPTVYRHFPNRAALLGALESHLGEILEAPPIPAAVADLPATALAIARCRGRHELLACAAQRVGVMRELREHGRELRDVEFGAAVAADTRHLAAPEAAAATALLRMLTGNDVWVALHEHFGLDAETAGRVCAWALGALLATLRRDRAAGRAALVDDDTVARADELMDGAGRGAGGAPRTGRGRGDHGGRGGAVRGVARGRGDGGPRAGRRQGGQAR